jgi:hypothetical protein
MNECTRDSIINSDSIINRMDSVNIGSEASVQHSDTDHTPRGGNGKHKGRGRPPSVDPVLFVARHRQRSREYYQRNSRTQPRSQCEFINTQTQVQCTRTTRVKLAPDGVTTLRCYCSAHRYRDKINYRNALKDTMTNLD